MNQCCCSCQTLPSASDLLHLQPQSLPIQRSKLLCRGEGCDSPARVLPQTLYERQEVLQPDTKYDQAYIPSGLGHSSGLLCAGARRYSGYCVRISDTGVRPICFTKRIVTIKPWFNDLAEAILVCIVESCALRNGQIRICQVLKRHENELEYCGFR